MPDIAPPRSRRAIVSALLIHKSQASGLQFRLFFWLCACLVAAHLLVVSFAPRSADGFIYGLWAASILTYAGVVFVQVRSASGMLALRWTLFALSLVFYAANDIRAAIEQFTHVDVPRLDSILIAIAATFTLLAITLPSSDRVARLSLLDGLVAIVFCGFRFMHLLMLSAPTTPVAVTLAHYTFDPLVRVSLALLALAASPWSKRSLYRNISLYLSADLFASFCANQVGYLWLHQEAASPWTLPGTIVPIAAGLFLLGSLTTTHAQSRIQVTESRKPVLRALLPFALTVLIVLLAAQLLPVHPHLAKLGMAFAAAAFFTRVAILAYHQELTERSLRNALRNQNWKDGPDPLDKVEPETSFGPALWKARPHVTRDTPLSLLLIKVEEVADGLVLVEEGLESGHMIHIARDLAQWRPSHSSLYYCGHSVFGMLLPSITSRSAAELSGQIRTSIEALCLVGESGLIRLTIGAATAITPEETDRLFATASRLLPDQPLR